MTVEFIPRKIDEKSLPVFFNGPTYIGLVEMYAQHVPPRTDLSFVSPEYWKKDKNRKYIFQAGASTEGKDTIMIYDINGGDEGSGSEIDIKTVPEGGLPVRLRLPGEDQEWRDGTFVYLNDEI